MAHTEDDVQLDGAGPRKSFDELSTEEQVLEFADTVATWRKRPLLTLITGRSSINANLLSSVYNAVPLRRFSKLDVLLDSSGGQGQAAVGIIELLQRQAKHVSVLVPRRAMSAATILAMGATIVELGPAGQLGPTDTQVTLETRSDRGGSALDELAIGDELRRVIGHTVELLNDEDYQHFIPTVAIEKIAKHVGEELADQISLADQARCEHLLQATQRSLTVLLRHSGRSGQRASTIAHRLTRSITNHGYFLGLYEAQELDLPVMGMDQEQAIAGFLAGELSDDLDEPVVRLLNVA